jgi:hypothetical protein
MPADDLVLNVKQIANYPEVGSAAGANFVVMQQTGLGGPYASIEAAAMVGTALQGSTIPLQLGVDAPADAVGGQIFTDAVVTPLGGWFGWNAYGSTSGGLPALVPGAPGAARLVYEAGGWGFQAWVGGVWTNPILISPLGYMTINPGQTVLLGRDPTGGFEAATAQWVSALRAASVTSFNGRFGDVVLNRDDIICASGAPIASPYFVGVPRAPTPDPASNSTKIATTEFVQGAIAATLVSDVLVASFNGRTGAVVLTSADVVAANPPFAPLDSPNFTGYATSLTPPQGTSDGQIATTAFVMNAVADSTTGVASFNGRTGVVVLIGADLTGAGGALLASPAFTGTPTAPTPPPGDSSTRLATTAFVQAGGSFAPINSPAFTGVPTAPTASVGTDTTQLATTAFVIGEINAVNAGVISFNGRTGAVSLLANDISAAGGATLASPIFTGLPSAPTANPGANTTQLATTQFVTAAIAALPPVPVASTANPLMNGTATPGVATAWSRGDHVHPTDTSRAAASALASYLPLVGGTLSGALTAPQANGTSSVNVTAATGNNAYFNSFINGVLQSTFGFQQTTGATIMANAVTGDTAELAANNAFVVGPITTGAFKPGGGAWSSSSDARTKTVRGDYTQGLNEVIQLNPIVYSYRGNDAPPQGRSAHAGLSAKSFIGLVAQAVETVMPEMVTARAGYIDGKPVDDARDLDTSPLLFALVNAVKTLAARLAALETRHEVTP